ncbi:MAG TPA: hypothetical protein VHR84_14945 [Terriglobales bacterium]|jgi:hypothetical protein|nr:hypothetical protein [Terriglobales bacterium]
MSTPQIDNLQLKAIEQRKQLHKTASDLREKVHETRDKLSFSNQAREHFPIVAGIAGLLGLASGFAFAGIFTRD